MAQFDIVEEEEKILKFWKENDIFRKSVVQRKDNKPFVFFEGPPTANGKPGIHHVIGRAFKDIILRYKTMRGHWVWRRAGWDTHGLPVEIEVEKELGLKTKKEIEKYGIARFNAKCKESVWRYKGEWDRFTERMGFWIDLGDPYITYEPAYIENLWAIFKKFWQKKLLFEDFKVVPYCVRCGTPISSHEVAQGYETVTDRSVYVKFKIKGEDNTYLLAWTTTPWTLPGNVALAVGESIDYLEVEPPSGGSTSYIVAKERASILGEGYKALREFKGKDLVGLEYEPLFEIPELKSEKSYKVYPAGFVSTEEGTGIVHTAVMYGVDDFDLGTKVGLPKVHTVTEDGRFIESVPVVGGRTVVVGTLKNLETEKAILEYLREKNLVFKEEDYPHEYPFCWRCGTPLLYYARRSWFVGASQKRKELIKNNQKINWIPEHIKDGRFGEWLREAKDWAISRERYWGTPLPIWRCESCGEKTAVGSLEELNKKRPGKATTFVLMRHGKALSNERKIMSSHPEKFENPLTINGRKTVEKNAKKLSKLGITKIISSDLLRTRQTAAIVGEHLNLPIETNHELREVDLGVLNGHSAAEYDSFFKVVRDRLGKSPDAGESWSEVEQRVWRFIYSWAKENSGETVLVVSHGLPLVLLEARLRGITDESSIYEWHDSHELRPGEFRVLEFPNWPFNDMGEVDLHRPYVDEIKISCEKCGKSMVRVKELADVWFDSGAMPFAQPVSKDSNEKKKLGEPIKGQFPADYIVEGLDQTRGWFYTLHAISTLLGQGPSYKNVITHGLVLDKKGKKMSKSIGNVVEPWDAINQYGIDALRWYFFTVNAPGEPKLFDLNDVGERYRKFVMTVINSLAFLETYWDKNAADETFELSDKDRWIKSRLVEVGDSVTESLDNYDVVSAARKVDEFVQDLSNWYIRLSRERLQNPETTPAKTSTQRVFWGVMVNLSKILAPFTPFLAEVLFHRLSDLRDGEKSESVHLADWPEAKELGKREPELEKGMKLAQELASSALAQRAKAGIKVRQPLVFYLNPKDFHTLQASGITDTLKTQINAAQIVEKKTQNAIELVKEITPALEREGVLRELTRADNDLRKKIGLTPADHIELHVRVQKPDGSAENISDKEEFLKKETRADQIILKGEPPARLGEARHRRPAALADEREFEERGWKVWVGIRKI